MPSKKKNITILFCVFWSHTIAFLWKQTKIWVVNDHNYNANYNCEVLIIILIPITQFWKGFQLYCSSFFQLMNDENWQPNGLAFKVTYNITERYAYNKQKMIISRCECLCSYCSWCKQAFRVGKWVWEQQEGEKALFLTQRSHTASKNLYIANNLYTIDYYFDTFFPFLSFSQVMFFFYVGKIIISFLLQWKKKKILREWHEI